MRVNYINCSQDVEDCDDCGSMIFPATMHMCRPPVYPKNDFELACYCSKRLEAELRENFGAKGGGLAQLLESVKSQLRPSLVESIRYVAIQRNGLVHGWDVKRLPDRALFIQRYERAIRGY